MNTEHVAPAPADSRRRRRRKRRSANKRFLRYILLSAIMGAVAVAGFLLILNRPSEAVSAKSRTLEQILNRP